MERAQRVNVEHDWFTAIGSPLPLDAPGDGAFARPCLAGENDRGRGPVACLPGSGTRDEQRADVLVEDLAGLGLGQIVFRRVGADHR